MYIRAERTGNRELHLSYVSEMLNLFAATGHLHYAKSARYYLQQMLEVPNTHPEIYLNFTRNGYHAIRRTGRYWAGLWSDLIIEQVMMRSIKGRGGLPVEEDLAKVYVDLNCPLMYRSRFHD